LSAAAAEASGGASATALVSGFISCVLAPSCGLVSCGFSCLSVGLSDFPAGSPRVCLDSRAPALLAAPYLRYRLPNLPHSSACSGRAQHRLVRAFAQAGYTSCHLRLVLHFVHLCCHHYVWLLMVFEPTLQFEIGFHPPPPGVQHQNGKFKSRSSH